MQSGPAVRLWWGLGLSLTLHAVLLGLARPSLPKLSFRTPLPSMAVVIESPRTARRQPERHQPSPQPLRQARPEPKTRSPVMSQQSRPPVKPRPASRPRTRVSAYTPSRKTVNPVQHAREKPQPALDRARIVARLHKALRAHFTYPPLARRRNIEGRVLLGFGIDGTGAIHNVRVMRSSGHAILDLAAERAIRRLHRVQWYPAISGGRATEIELPVEYRLTPERGT